MEESSRESQPRCPCGFWGSSKTLGLCSKCYRKALRNQTQGNSNTADAGKTAVGTCHSQSQTSSQGKRMDSKHFPSRSTADNLPSSLSSPPGERASLSAAPTSPVDATTPTTSGTATSSHLPPPMSAGGGDVAQTESATITLPSCDSLLSSEDSNLCSAASSDLSYDSKCDASSYASDFCSSLVSVASSSAATISSFATSENSEESSSMDTQTLENQSSVTGGTLKADIASNSSTQSSLDSVKSCADTVTGVSNMAASSSKNPIAKNVEKIDISTPCDINSQASSSRNCPLTNASKSIEQAPVEANISSAPARGIKRSRDEMEAASEECPASSPQKNKRRCFICSCKLELAQRTIGRCRCDRVFCARHRLPEMHKCEFNHKEDGRREAREKMVKPTRHLGPSYRREDHS